MNQLGFNICGTAAALLALPPGSTRDAFTTLTANSIVHRSYRG